VKIDEVVNEGFGDRVRSKMSSYVPGTAAYQMRQAANSPQAKAASANIKQELAQWQQFIKAKKPSTWGEYYNELETWAGARYPSANHGVDVSNVNPTKPATVVKYITDMYNLAMANRQVAGNQTTPANNDDTPIEPDTTVNTQAGPTSAKNILDNFKVAHEEPLVISYGKKMFHLNSTGQWAYLGSDTPIKDQTTSALLTQFADSQGL